MSHVEMPHAETVHGMIIPDPLPEKNINHYWALSFILVGSKIRDDICGGLNCYLYGESLTQVLVECIVVRNENGLRRQVQFC